MEYAQILWQPGWHFQLYAAHQLNLGPTFWLPIHLLTSLEFMCFLRFKINIKLKSDPKRVNLLDFGVHKFGGLFERNTDILYAVSSCSKEPLLSQLLGGLATISCTRVDCHSRRKTPTLLRSPRCAPRQQQLQRFIHVR